MPRPRRCRRVGFQPGITHFKPAGIGLSGMNEVVLTMGEFEAIRLKDNEGMEQEKAAKKMDISQPTFHRLLLGARKKVADALVNSKAIKIEGGTYKMVSPGRGQGRGMGQGMGQGRGSGTGQGTGGRGRMGGFAAGLGGTCVCPKCGYKVQHARGTPCNKIKCPKCDILMTRGD
jgi:uncharacterized protein